MNTKKKEKRETPIKDGDARPDMPAESRKEENDALTKKKNLRRSG